MRTLGLVLVLPFSLASLGCYELEPFKGYQHDEWAVPQVWRLNRVTGDVCLLAVGEDNIDEFRCTN